MLFAVLVYPAYRQVDCWRRVERGRQFLIHEDISKAVDCLAKTTADYPGSDRAAFFAAVAYRRQGDDRQFETALRRAENLGYHPAEIRLQQLLVSTQNGVADPRTDEELNRVCLQGADDFVAEQIYEARAKGMMSLFRVTEALEVLRFWIDWRPKAVIPRLLRAQIYEQLENMKQAEDDYRVVVEQAPDNVDARVRFGEFLTIKQQYDAALAEFQRCAEIAPDDPRGVLGMAEVRLRQGGNLAETRKDLEALLEKELQENVRGHVVRLLSNVYLASKEFQRVVALLEGGRDTKRLDIPSCQALIRAYSALNQREKAEQCRLILDEKMRRRNKITEKYELIVKNPGDADLRYQMGELFLQEGTRETAVTWWCTAVLAEPLHQASHEALADYYASCEEFDRAQAHRQLAEKSVERTFHLAWNDYVNFDRERAVAMKEKIKAVEKYPSYRPYAELLRCALELKEQQLNFNPANFVVLRRLTDYPHLRVYALTVLGAALYQQGEMGAAEEVLLEAIQIDPRSVEGHRWLAAINFDVRALQRAIFHCREVARLEPEDYRPHRLIGLIQKSMASFEGAVLAYQEALRLNPKEPTRQEIQQELVESLVRALRYGEALAMIDVLDESMRRELLRSECLISTNRSAEAEKVLDAILEKEPENAEALLLRSDIAIVDNELDAAVDYLKRVLKTLPFNESAWFKLSQIYNRQGKSAEAAEAQKRATELRNYRIEYSVQEEKAVAAPEDIAVRKRLAVLARQFGRADLAEEWERAAELLENKLKYVKETAAAPAQPLLPAGLELVPGRQPQPAPSSGGNVIGAILPSSGPQIGASLGELPATAVRGSDAGKIIDPVAQAKGAPLLLIFVHQPNRSSLDMARLVGGYAGKRGDDGMRSAVLFFSEEAAEIEDWLSSSRLPDAVQVAVANDKSLAERYGLNRKAQITLLVARQGKVTASFSLPRPNVFADAPQVLQAVVDVLGGGKAPTLEELGVVAGPAAPRKPEKAAK